MEFILSKDKYATSVAVDETKSSISFYLTNQVGERIYSQNISAPLNVSEYTVEIPSEYNEESLEGYRMLTIINKVDDISEKTVKEYLIKGEEPELEVMKNSYQTFGEAQLIASNEPNMTTWFDTDASLRTSGLISAFHKLGNVVYTIAGVEYNNINKLSKDEFNSLDPKFIEAIKRAQLIQADIDVGNDQYEVFSKYNILSQTVGETSTMFRTGVSSNSRTSLSNETMKIMSRYISRSIKIGRS